VLQAATEEITGREVARRAAGQGGPSRSSVQRALDVLAAAGAVRYRRMFAGRLYRLNRHDPLVRSLLPLLEQDRLVHLDLEAAARAAVEGRTEELGVLAVTLAAGPADGPLHIVAVPRHTALPAAVTEALGDALHHLTYASDRAVQVEVLSMQQLKERSSRDEGFRTEVVERGVTLLGAALSRLAQY
jgi:DNA-binding transcriptional ArsR family regulator